MTSAMISAIEHLVNLLKTASNYYYNGGQLLLDNTSYDALLEEIRVLDPKNPFLTTIGCPPLKTLCFLPAYMPLKRVSASPHIIYENHDGLTALWCPSTKSLYLRGNDRQGQSIRAIVPHIRGLIYNSTDNWMIRGNLVISKKVIKDRHLARSTLNTLLYAREIDPDFLSNISFIPYQVIVPSQPTPRKQFEWLEKQGFQVPWWIPWWITNEESPSLYYLRRRVRSEYHMKGMTII